MIGDVIERGTRLRPTILTVGGRPGWVLSGQLGLVISIVFGFGAYSNAKPNLFAAAMILSAAGVVLLGPHGNAKRMIVSLPVMAIVVWWVSSGAWTSNYGGWRRDTSLEIPLLLSLVVICGLLPVRDILNGLVAGCYVAMGYTVLQTVVRGPGRWTGGFIDKNGIAPFMVFAMLVLVSFEPSRIRRRAGCAVGVFFILMSQSTTVLVVGVIIAPLTWIVRKAARSTESSRKLLLISSLTGAAAIGSVLVLTAPQLLAARGKDPTLTRRTEIWAGVMDAIALRPWVGYGAGGVWINPGSEPARSILAPLGFTVFHAHNGYLEFALELGYIGLALLLILIASALYNGIGLLSTETDFGAFLVLFIATICLVSLVEVATFGIWLAMLCGLHVVSIRLRASHGPTP